MAAVFDGDPEPLYDIIILDPDADDVTIGVQPAAIADDQADAERRRQRNIEMKFAFMNEFAALAPGQEGVGNGNTEKPASTNTQAHTVVIDVQREFDCY